ncbi:tyrosyl-tRNA synthetase [Saxophila tyrrhenica]|uniref:Tyrosine--tRNA ligase n=1 Tax=Saxophila tyrrhenica TaxID=1690608 RepID=A0AAV9PDJ0_9PEZI|nr:tyrosyl-tRNA synthetase [Saxophila tyrrhenica]
MKRQSSNLLDTLESRGLINQIAGDRNALHSLLQSKKLSFYAGIDPTAPSLHLGHLLPLMVLFWTAIHGHNAVSLVGGATARVGDPSGRLTSRADTAGEVQRTNFKSMFSQVGSLWKTALLYAERSGNEKEKMGQQTLLDNAQWLDGLTVLDFLKMLGSGMRLGTMLGRDTVKNKMEKGDGMSFAEFTYPLLQGWDWWHMYSKMGVQIQVGGSDQYGNIIAGMDAVKHIAQASAPDGEQPQWLDTEGRMRSEDAPMGLTVPLLTTSAGEKFGKSAGNAVWLDGSMTSPFDLYGFLLRSADADVERYLKLFTFVPLITIAEVMRAHSTDPGKRKAQHLLAREVLALVHGNEVAMKTQQEHHAMRNPTLASSGPYSGTESGSVVIPTSEVIGQSWARVLATAGLAASRSEGTRMLKSGAVYTASNSGKGATLQFNAVNDPRVVVGRGDLVDGKLLLRIGKWKVRVVEVVDDKIR